MSDMFTRSPLNPILRPQGSEWWKIYNPGAALDLQGRVHLFPRVMKQETDWHSRIAHTVSNGGEHFEWDSKPALVRMDASEKRGLEDPRVTFIDGTYYMTFAAYDGKKVALHSAVAQSLGGPWQRRGPMVPDFDFFKSGGRMVRWENGKPVEKSSSVRGSHWSKSGALFPERIDGKYTLVFGEFYMWLATSDDGARYQVEQVPILTPRKGTSYFDNTFIETGPPPILTDKGWLLLYHGIDEVFRYQIGFVLLDRENPRNILYRSKEPVFGPQEEYELGESLIDVLPRGVETLIRMSDKELKEHYKRARNENVFPQVTFCPGAIVQDGILRLYYGAGDTSLCTASAPLKSILEIAN